MVGTISPLPADLQRQLEKPVANILSMSNLVTFEGFVNSSISLFFSRVDEIYLNGKSCNLDASLEWFVFDTLGDLTFSEKYGFLERREDVDNIIRDVETLFDKVALVSLKKRFPANGRLTWRRLARYRGSTRS